MDIITENEQTAEAERLEEASELLAHRESVLLQKNFLSSDIKEYVISVIDEELVKLNSNAMIPEDATLEERGQHSLAMLLAYNRLSAVKKRLEQEIVLED